jgi:hypothetical protein
MNVVCAQEAVFLVPDGSGTDSEFVRRACKEALRHYAAPSTQVRPADALAAILGETYEALGRIKVDAVKKEASDFLPKLTAALLRFDLTSAPAMAAVVLDDESFVIEWAFASRRLGFSFDPQPGESGWFFVSSLDSGNVRAHGRLVGAELIFLLAWALEQNPRR